MSTQTQRAAIESFRQDAAQRMGEGETVSRGRWTIPIRGYELPPACALTDGDAKKLSHEDL